MVRLLLRESAVPMDYPRGGRAGQAMVTQSNGHAERVDRGGAELNHGMVLSAALSTRFVGGDT
jgi:hypothetical protein